MHRFKLVLSPRAVKDLDGFSDSVCAKISKAMQTLGDNPFPRGKLIKKVKGKKSVFYRLRVDKHRVFYFIEEDRTVIIRVLSKKEAQRFIQGMN